MTTQNLTLPQFADLLSIEAERGIINGKALLDLIKGNRLPKIIYDIRGEVRLAIERAGDGLAVTEYLTDLVKEKINRAA